MVQPHLILKDLNKQEQLIYNSKNYLKLSIKCCQNKHIKKYTYTIIIFLFSCHI